MIDFDRATTEEGEWFAANRRLFSKVGAKIIPVFSWDDFENWAFPMAVRALRRYDPGKGTTLSGFVVRYFVMELRHPATRGRGNFFPVIGNDVPKRKEFKINPYLFGGKCHIDLRRDRPPADMEETHAAVRHAFARLSPRHRKTLSLWLGFNGPRRTLTELAKALGVTRARVQQITAAALNEIAAVIGTRPPVRNVKMRLRGAGSRSRKILAP